VDVDFFALNSVNVKEICLFKKKQYTLYFGTDGVFGLAGWGDDEVCFNFIYNAVFFVDLSRYDFGLSANQAVLMWQKIMRRWPHVLYLRYNITCLRFFFLVGEMVREIDMFLYVSCCRLI
jgi:hypothetical protein